MIIPDPPEPPAVNSLAQRVWMLLPQAYRDYDSGLGWPLLLYVDALTRLSGDIQDTAERIAGVRPVGPAAPAPWALRGDELTRWQAARTAAPSQLGDPVTADPAWLVWMAQLVGARIGFTADTVERRNAVRYAYAGWKAGTPGSIEYAARTALTGSQYARVDAFTRADATTPTVWDVTLTTRSSETPDPAAVLAAVDRAGVKPAGVVLHHRLYEASWDVLEASRPTWALWETDPGGTVTWDRLAETGLSYASVPGNLITNASYETGTTTGWTAGTNTTQAVISGGVDALYCARLTATATGQVSQRATAFAVTSGHDYRISTSVKPSVGRTARIRASWTSGGSSAGVDTVLSAGQWTPRMVAILTAPATTTATVSIEIDGLAAAETVLIDAWDAREYTG